MRRSDTERRIRAIESRLMELPQGTLIYKTINGKKQPYLQWTETGRSKSRYIKISERDEVLEQIELKNTLSSELKKLKKELSKDEMPQGYGCDPAYGSLSAAERIALDSYNAGEALFSTRVIRGDELKKQVESVKSLDKRDCYAGLRNFLHADSRDRVCLLYGLRRTGKTTLINQAILELSDAERRRAAYIKIRMPDAMEDVNRDLILLSKLGYKHVFIDEVTLMSDFIDSAALFSDVFAAQGMKIVLSGTDSLGFWMTLTGELYDRAYVIHTTYIPFREYSRLLGVDDVDEYIRYGGTLRRGEAVFNSPATMNEEAAFRDDESTRRYIDSAICRNIQHSLAFCKDGRYFRHLRELYDSDELTGAINRIIEKMNHRFVLSTLTEKFKSRDYGSAAEMLRKNPDASRRSDILDIIDKEKVTKRLMDILEIKDAEDLKTGLRDVHVEEIKQYLSALDLVADCPSETATGGTKDTEYALFTQPGMRYSQAEALIYILKSDKIFENFSEREKNLACSVILEDVRGRMMEDIILLDTARALQGDKNKRAFKLILRRSEVDMVIYDAASDSCDLFEIKHSEEIAARQYHVLEDEEALKSIEDKYGSISGRYIIYRGPAKLLDNGIEYINAETYLKSLAN